MRRYVFGIDPGTGSSSPAAVAFYDTQEKIVLWSDDVWPLGHKVKTKMPNHHRIGMIRKRIKDLWDDAESQYGTDNMGVAMENFVMKGIGGATLQMFRGAILTIFPYTVPCVEVHNTSMKKLVGGTGKADKIKIGLALMCKIRNNEAMIQELLDLKLYDQIDAIGIAYAAKF